MFTSKTVVEDIPAAAYDSDNSGDDSEDEDSPNQLNKKATASRKKRGLKILSVKV